MHNKQPARTRQEAMNNLEWLFVTNVARNDGESESEEFCAVPYTAVLPKELPPHLRHYGSLLRQDADDERLARHFIRQRSLLNMNNQLLLSLASMLGAPLKKLGEKIWSSRVWSIPS